VQRDVGDIIRCVYLWSLRRIYYIMASEDYESSILQRLRVIELVYKSKTRSDLSVCLLTHSKETKHLR
jgi:hypothetical protein